MISIEFINELFINNIIIDYEDDNKDYEGILFENNDQIYRSRVGKKTPKKQGYFTTFWRKDNNTNVPYSINDVFDYLIIFIIDNDKLGYFKFPKEVLLEKGIIKSLHKPGKMGSRFYTPWCFDLNNTEKRSQLWQTKYFNKL